MVSINATLRRTGMRPVTAIVLAVLMVLAAVVATNYLTGEDSQSKAFPQSAQMEEELGIRFTRVAVVGAGGLVTVTYVVLDTEKAARFQADSAHPPVLVSESRPGAATRVSLMKQGHKLRAGQTYYLVYQNAGGVVQSGKKVTIVDAGLELEHAPVL